MDIPMCKEDMLKLNIDKLDVILVTGDAFVDHPSYGVAIIARVLKEMCGLRVGIISQPDWNSEKDITRLGEPNLFFGITGGNMDSMVSNYTASKRKRKIDVYSPDKIFRPRPDRAVIVYSNLIRKYFKKIPIIIGGIEASLRRFAHYDWWQDKIKNSILLDSKADLLVYGMGEKAIVNVAYILKNNNKLSDCYKLNGIVYQTSKLDGLDNYIEIPSLEDIKENKKEYINCYKIIHENNNPYSLISLIQKHQNRFVVQTPPEKPLSIEEMDSIYSLNYSKQIHPYDANKGYIQSFDSIKNSITIHRGCYGECSFCAISLHQGRYIQQRSPDSIIQEIKILSKKPYFNGYVSDLGGPTANMYGFECSKKLTLGACKDKSCIGSEICVNLKISHKNYLDLLNKVNDLPFVKRVYISSGIRMDLVFADKKYGSDFLKELISKYTPGKIKIAPEHTEKEILNLMNKPDFSITEKYINFYNEFIKKNEINHSYSAYLIVAHPGENVDTVKNMLNKLKNIDKFPIESVQIFTPTPMTKSTTMYYSELNYINFEDICVEKNEKLRKKLKNMLFN